MNGIQYLTDEKGRKTSVLIDLRKHKKLWEDFQDILVAERRAKEPRYSFEEVTRDLRKSGKLRGK